MRILVQLVKEASVIVDDKEVSRIARGFLLFVGFKPEDNPEIASKMVEKVLKLRIFPDENGKTNLSLDQVKGEILSVSQFTLYGSVKEGNRPSFVESMKADEARTLYARFNEILREKVPNLKEGIFQADMKVHLVNDGPFTLWLDSDELLK